MLAVISPAKTLDFTSPVRTRKHTKPTFQADADSLVETLRAFPPARLATLMDISDKLAEENHARYAAWSSAPDQRVTRQALFAFMGEVYVGLDARTLTPRDLDWAQSRLCILSGLYGILRPLDRIQPYRLEMGTALANPRGRNLYAWWGSRQAEALNVLGAEVRTRYLVNLASNEYFGAVDRQALALEVITPTFKEGRGGEYRVLSFFAKRARGLMARWLVQRRCRKPEQLLDFDVDGYRYNDALSTALTPVFTRDSAT